ncbi:MAG: hypothetical protein Q9M91_07720 [Candidatus Dojkabacteria bacterium]|nr:hypothetical protein [Candidatus Dojkabacteria bacterium]MDQ7021674.1 hypothetical protein [Candidatus Dojkabacteria bacterium]
MKDDLWVKSKYYQYSKSAPLLIYLSGWDIKMWYQRPLFRHVSKKGFNVLAFSYSRDILKPNPDPKKHFERFKTIYDQIKKISDQYIADSTDLNIIGSSVGSTLGFILGSEYSDKTKNVVLNLYTSDFVESLWKWKKDMYKLLSKDFAKHVENKDIYLSTGKSIDDARKDWIFMRLQTHVNKYNPNKTKFLLYSSLKDKIIPFEKNDQLEESLKSGNFNYKRIINKQSRGHLTAGFINLIKTNQWIEFLKS